MRKEWTLSPVLLLLLLAGCRVSPPGAFERAVAKQVKQKITVGSKGEVNPLAATPENIQAGRKAFSHYCIVCHGLDGQNTGVPFADRMSPPVPPLNSPDVQAYTDGQLKWVITNGIYPSGMPASKDILNEDEIWAIVQYIRHLPLRGSLGEPAVYTGELEGPAADPERSQARAAMKGFLGTGAPFDSPSSTNSLDVLSCMDTRRVLCLKVSFSRCICW